MDAQITFQKDEKDQVKKLILHQNGVDQPAKKVSSMVPVRKAITVAPEIFSSYVGKYELAPNFVIAVTSEHGSLFLQATGQPRFEMFAESETSWFLKDVDAQVTFVKEAGKVNQIFCIRTAPTSRRVVSTDPLLVFDRKRQSNHRIDDRIDERGFLLISDAGTPGVDTETDWPCVQEANANLPFSPTRCPRWVIRANIHRSSPARD